MLVNEEMRRVIAYLEWKSTWWIEQAHQRGDVRSDIASGLEAYADRQSSLMQSLARSFASLWYPLLRKTDISIEWPSTYIIHAQKYPTVLREGRRRKAVPIQRPESDDSENDSEEEEDDDDGLSGDDEDVSPYR